MNFAIFWEIAHEKNYTHFYVMLFIEYSLQPRRV